MGLGNRTGVTPEQLRAATNQLPGSADSDSFTPNVNGELGPAPALSLPASIPVKDLEEVHPEYDAEMIKQYGLLYAGGKKFRAEADQFIVKRQIEEGYSGCEGASGHYTARKKRSWYIPRGPGVLDWIIDSTFKKGLKVETGDEPDRTPDPVTGVVPEPKEPEENYWTDLNYDADGKGNSLNQVAKNAQRQIELFGRGYFYLYFDKTEATAADATAKDARIRYLPASAVDDWERDANGKLLWVRLHSRDLVRSAPPAQPDLERHYWTFITATETVVYSAEKKLKESWKDDAVASRQTKDGTHDFGALPVYEIPAPAGTHIMDRLYEALVALYNREISITWALDQLAYAIPVFKVENNRDLGKIVASELGAIKLGAMEDMVFKSPDPQIFDPLFKDDERLKKAVYEILQASALTTASQTQNARQSATAKLLDRDLLHVLLVAFAEPIRNTLEQIIDDLKEYRSDSTKVRLVGLDEFDATMDEVTELLSGKAQQPVPGAKQLNNAAVGNQKGPNEEQET